MQWVDFHADLLMADFPSDLRPLYDAWILQYPDKADRLEMVIANTRSEFRDSILNNPENTLNPNETTIPESCVRSAETIVFYNLMMEMGLPIKAEAQQSMTRAEMFLRQISYKHFRTLGTSAAVCSPHYTVPGSTAERVIP